MAKTAKHPIQRLQLALVSENDKGTIMKFQIGAQSYRNEDFGHNGRFKDPETGITLMSSTAPSNEELADYSEMYVRGDNTDEDEKIMECNSDTWGRLVGAVQGFNKQFMGTPEAVGIGLAQFKLNLKLVFCTNIKGEGRRSYFSPAMLA